jgi:transcriptional regulator GlxA family with amidase domain
MRDSSVYTAAVIMTPGFSLMSFSALIEPLRGANRIAGARIFSWNLLSATGGTIVASSGLEVKTLAIPSHDVGFDLVVLCGGHEDEKYTDKKIRDFVRSVKLRDTIIGSVSTASFILADAGLLDGRRCTTHWDYVDSFRERFPQLDVCNEVFVVDRRIFTCGGGIAAMDVMLEIIRGLKGDEFTNRVSENFVYGRVRRHDDSQRMPLRMRLGVSHPTLIEAVSLMEANTETPLRLPVLSQRLGISSRQLERLFDDRLKCSPAQYYVRVRLSRAQGLLRHSSMSVFEIAVACGFTSASHFSRTYRLRFGCAPSADRRMTTLSLLD